jgi:hypothetical protein
MNVIALNGSARGKKGVTWRLLDSLLKGLSEGGATVRDFQLKEMNISCCRACLTCMHKTPGQCAQRDDMDRLYPTLRESDLLVMGTPVFTDNMSAQMKTVMDRCICGMDPFLRLDPAKRVRHLYNWTMPSKFFLVSTSGFPEVNNFLPQRGGELELSCKEIAKVLRRGGQAVFVIARRSVGGWRLNLDHFLIDTFMRQNLQLDEICTRRIEGKMTPLVSCN